MSDKLERLSPLHYFPIAEKFVSINGEGPHQGTPAAFIRLVGCNLSCSYCDTTWACSKKCPCEKLDAWQLCEWVAKTGMSAVTITGGEPTIHPMLGELLRMLVNGTGTRETPFEMPSNLNVEVESNGSVDLQKIFTLLRFLPEKQSSRIHFTLDYKLPTSGMEGEMCIPNYALLRPCDTVKFVVGSEEDMKRALTVASELNLWQRVQVFFSPVFGQIEPASVAQFLIDSKLVHARMQLQLHKILWPEQSRGV